MTNSILIAYATKYGSTAEIAEKIGQTLRDIGWRTDVRAAEEVRDLNGYQAVIVGSAVYAGTWRKEAVDLLTAYEAELAQRPVWFFSSGPTGTGDPSELMKGWRFPEAQRPIADRVQPRDIAFFHGFINLKRLNLAEKLLVKGIKAPTGDSRDWNSITAWAANIAATLKAEN